MLREARSGSATIKEVARAAGVSIKTVSRVANGAVHVGAGTRRRVLRAMERLRYRPNALARGLVTRRSRSIGLVIADIVNLFFPPFVRAVEDTAATRGYNVILCDTDEDPARERAAIALLLEKQVDGLILCASRMPAAYLRELADGGVPVVMVNRILAHPRAAAIVLDGVEGGRRATLHLLDRGFRRIAYLAGPALSYSNRKRLDGYRKALAARGIEFDPKLVTDGTKASIGAGREAMAALLKRAGAPEGVFAFDDLMAIGAMEELRRRGLRIPDDVAVVGFDDIDLAAFVDPPLTTVAQPKGEMGRLAADRLLEMIETAAAPRVRTTVLVPELIIRQSGGAPGTVPGPVSQGALS